MTRTERETARKALRIAIARAGGTVALAREIGIKSPAISQWEICPPLRVIAVEAVTGVSRHDLRPDMYPLAADRGTYIGLSRDAMGHTNAPPDSFARAQNEGLPVEVRNDEAACAVGGGERTPAQASAFVTASGAGEVCTSAVDPAPAPDGRYPRLDIPLASHQRLTADGDRISVRQFPREA